VFPFGCKGILSVGQSHIPAARAVPYVAIRGPNRPTSARRLSVVPVQRPVRKGSEVQPRGSWLPRRLAATLLASGGGLVQVHVLKRLLRHAADEHDSGGRG